MQETTGTALAVLDAVADEALCVAFYGHFDGLMREVLENAIALHQQVAAAHSALTQGDIATAGLEAQQAALIRELETLRHERSETRGELERLAADRAEADGALAELLRQRTTVEREVQLLEDRITRMSVQLRRLLDSRLGALGTPAGPMPRDGAGSTAIAPAEGWLSGAPALKPPSAGAAD